jgi:hypothetical protein
VEQLAPLYSQLITGHEQLAADVTQTTYEDGSRVIVNYGSEAYVAGSGSDGTPLSVPAQDFIVIPGD